MRPTHTRSILTALFLFAPGCILNTAFPYNPRFSDADDDGKAYIDGDCDEWPGHGGKPVIAGKGIYDSLQAAVDAAKDGDVITVCPLPPEKEYGGLTVIEGKSISIVGGDDPENIVLNGKDAGSTIRISGGSLTLENLTITGDTGTNYTDGATRVNVGGGVDAWAADGLEIVNCIIQNNDADYGGGVMGPVVVENAETLILDSLITDNVGIFGAGIFVQWGGQVIGTSVYRNKGSYSGGIHSGPGTLTITASEIIANSANNLTNAGGGLAIEDGKLNVEASDFGDTNDTNNKYNDIMLENTSTGKTRLYNKNNGVTFSCDAAKQSCS